MIQRLQNNAARAVYNNYDYINSRGIDLVKSLNWMTVKQRIQYFTVTQMFKCIHGMAPNYLTNGIIMECEVNDRTTRSLNSLNVFVPFARTKAFEKSFSYHGAIAWNALPEYIKRICMLEEFKKEVKKYICDDDNDKNT